MEIKQFLSKPRQTPFAVEWSYVLGEDIIENINYSQIASVILSKEKEIISKYPSSSYSKGGLGEDSLSSRFKHFNVFAWEDPEIIKLKKEVLEKYTDFLDKFKLQRRKVWIQCWANVLRNNQAIDPHIHSITPFGYLVGHVCIQCEDTSTVYINPVDQIDNPEKFDSPNAVGKFTIFQSCIPHYTTVHTGKNERITLAFDLIVDEQLPHLTEDVKSNLVLFDNIKEHDE